MRDGGAELPERQQREERMRYEVLQMLHRAAKGAPDQVVNAWSFSTDLGIWHAEVFRVIEWLERHRLISYHGAGPAISITEAGVEYLNNGRHRCSPAGLSSPDPPSGCDP
jgi:CTP-dependent riboflavin kinase